MNAGQPIRERRANTYRLIEDLVNTRTEMLALFNQLAAMRPFDDREPVLDLLNDFCEILVDYTAAGHFSIYRFIEEGSERRRAVLELAQRIYPSILDSTRCIVEFNDRYVESADAGEVELEQLEDDLSTLGLRMADRIEYEDQLIAMLRAPR